MGVLTRIFSVAPVLAVGAALGACAGPKQNYAPCMEDKGVVVAGMGISATSYNERCGKTDAYVTMIKSGDTGSAIAGYKGLGKLYPDVQETTNETAREILRQPLKLECKVAAVNRANGKTEISMANCTPKIENQSPIMPVAKPEQSTPAVPVSMHHGVSGLKLG